MFLLSQGDMKIREVVTNKLKSLGGYDKKSYFVCCNRFTMLASTLVDEYGIDNVAAVIIRNDNPNLGKVLAEYGETIEMFSHKPSLG